MTSQPEKSAAESTGWVCPYCGPGVTATYEENCADCGHPLASAYVRALLQDLSTATERAKHLEQHAFDVESRFDALKLERNTALERAERAEKELESYYANHAIPMTITIGDHPAVKDALQAAADKLAEAERDKTELKRDIEKLWALQRDRSFPLEFKGWVMLRGRPLPRTFHRHLCDICGFAWEHARYQVQLMTKEGRTRAHICLNCGHLQREIEADRSDSAEQQEAEKEADDVRGEWAAEVARLQADLTTSRAAHDKTAIERDKLHGELMLARPVVEAVREFQEAEADCRRPTEDSRLWDVKYERRAKARDRLAARPLPPKETT